MADGVVLPIPLPPVASQPLVSVLVANFNYARFLPACLDSLIAQTYTHWEAVVCDDGSTDGSADVVRTYAAREPRIRLVEKSNGGQNSTVNACYPHLRGDVICLLDSDDAFMPDKLWQVVATLQNDPYAGVVNHFAHVIDGHGKRRDVTLNHRLDGGWLGDSAFSRGGCVYVPTTSCMSFRREVLDRLMPIPPEQTRDADGYLGMCAQFLARFAVIDAKLAGYRVHGNNMGGLTEPTPDRLAYELMLINDRTANLKKFVAKHFGPGIAQRLHAEDNPQYLQAALKMHAIGDKQHRKPLADAKTLVARHPSAKWRTLWGMIFSLPGPLRRRVLPMLHRGQRLKQFVHRRRRRPAGGRVTQAVLGVWALAIVVLGVLRPRWLPATAVVMCVFEGTALFKAGVAISPYYLCVMLVAAWCVTAKVTGDDWLGRTPAATSILTAMLLFVAIAVGGAVLLPRAFAGTAVFNPRLSEDGTTGLSFSTSNVGQSIYLVLSLALMWWTARQPGPTAMAKSMSRAVVIAGAIVVGLGVYQFAAAFAGLPFPDDVLYSNDNFTMQSNTAVGDMPRIHATFTEPAAMAVFLTGLLAFLTSDAGAAAGGWLRLPLLAGGVAVALLSTSTTAYVGLAAIGAWRLGPSLVVPLLRGKLSLRSTLLTVGGVAAVGIAIAVSPALQDLLRKMVLEKNQSSSFEDRGATDTHAWQLALNTFGLGTGLGSNRASGFLPSMFSTVGVYGGVLFFLTVLMLLRRPAGVHVRPQHTALSACLLGVVLAKIVSGPDMSTPSMWVMFAALLTTHAVSRTDARAAQGDVVTVGPTATGVRRPRFADASHGSPAGAGL